MKKQTKKKVISWIGQILLFIGIFSAISWWQKKDMLPTSSQELAPAFNLVSMNGEVFNFDPTQQSKNTLIYFFAPWCSVCHVSIDNIEAIRQSAPNQNNFIVIALDWKNKQEVEAFLAEHSLNMPILLGTEQTQLDYKIKGFPSYYVIGKNGLLRSKDFGYTTELGMRVRLGLTTVEEAG
jgi:thiol-disulfide isomerase/thioredoxin